MVRRGHPGSWSGAQRSRRATTARSLRPGTARTPGGLVGRPAEPSGDDGRAGGLRRGTAWANDCGAGDCGAERRGHGVAGDPRPCAAGSNMRIIGGTHEGAPAVDATLGRPAPDLRSVARDAVRHPGLPRRGRTECSTAAPAPARSAWKRLSRGAAHAVFIDRDPRAVALIRRNAAACGLGERCTVRRAALPSIFRRLAPDAFDLILLDPPYGAPEVGSMLAAAAARLGPEGRLVMEHARRLDPPAPPALEPLRSVRAGDSALRFYGLATVDGGCAGRGTMHATVPDGGA